MNNEGHRDGTVEQVREHGGAPAWASRDATSGRRASTIDIHSHVAIPQAAALAKPHLDLSTIPLAHFASAESKALGQKQEEDIRTRITSYDERLKDMEAMGLDMQLICRRPTSATTRCRSISRSRPRAW